MDEPIRELPLGLGMALAENIHAMEAFARMDDKSKANFIRGAKNARSQADMKEYVRTLTG